MRNLERPIRRTASGAALAVTLLSSAISVSAAIPAAPATAPQPAEVATTKPASPATGPATTPAIRTKFEASDPVDDYLDALAARYDVLVIKPESDTLIMLKPAEMPASLDDAIDQAQKLL